MVEYVIITFDYRYMNEAKRHIIETVKQLPEHLTEEQILDRLEIIRKVRRGRNDIEEVRTSSWEEVKEELRVWQNRLDV